MNAFPYQSLSCLALLRIREGSARGGTSTPGICLLNRHNRISAHSDCRFAPDRFVREVPMIAVGALVDSKLRALLPSPISEGLGNPLGVALLAAVLIPHNIHERF